MVTRDSGRAAGADGIGSLIQAAAIFLGAYVAMYLAATGVVHLLTSPNAAAAVTYIVVAPASAPNASAPAVAVRAREMLRRA